MGLFLFFGIKACSAVDNRIRKLYILEIIMNDSTSYKKMIKKHSPPSGILKNCLLAFITGGAICLLGESLASIYISLGKEADDAYLLSTVTLIALSALATGLGVFDTFARHSGAGTLVPVTGFANAVISPALDTRAEGYILGVGAKIFTVAGPVILYATVAGSVYGIFYYLFTVWS